MKKERYERTELEIFEFQTEDIIMTSGGFPRKKMTNYRSEGIADNFLKKDKT